MVEAVQILLKLEPEDLERLVKIMGEGAVGWRDFPDKVLEGAADKKVRTRRASLESGNGDFKAVPTTTRNRVRRTVAAPAGHPDA